MKLKEKKKAENMFECGVGKCDMQFRTSVGYVYHLNSSHGFVIDTFIKCRNFISELNLRLYGLSKGANGYYVDKLNFSDN